WLFHGQREAVESDPCSNSPASSQARAAEPWQVAQCLLRQLQYEISLRPHFLPALAVGYVDDHAGAVDVVSAQAHDLAGTQASGIGRHERDTIPPDRDRLQKGSDLLRA